MCYVLWCALCVFMFFVGGIYVTPGWIRLFLLKEFDSISLTEFVDVKARRMCSV